jgi:uncharacterized membrane protein YfcA
MLEFLTLVLAGGLVGYAVGLTGVGGGSLMTPILLLMGYPPPVAIGTDLLYAGLTKVGGMVVHHRKGNVLWRTVCLMAAGSLPVTMLLNFWLLDADIHNLPWYERLLTTTLGIMLLLTSMVVLFKNHIQRRMAANGGGSTSPGDGTDSNLKRDIWTFLLGVLLGVCVTLSSVGAGAFGAAALFMLLPKVSAVRIVGTDIAHAVPLALLGGLGYLYNGKVDFALLGGLLCGSLPGIYLGSHTGTRIPEGILRGILVTALCVLGIKFIFFSGH